MRAEFNRAYSFLSSGLRVDNRKIVIGYYVNYYTQSLHDGKHIIHGGRGSNQLYDSNCEIDVATLRQCTGYSVSVSYRGGGVFDKLLFDGDILRADVLNNFGGHESFAYFQVIRVGGSFKCQFIKSDTGEAYNFNRTAPDLLEDILALEDGDSFAVIELVGNLLDTPELTEVAQ